MVMRWHYALGGLIATVVLGVGFAKYMGTHPDLGHLTHIDTSGLQSYEDKAFELYVDFDQSMQSDVYAPRYKNQGLEQLLAYFRQMYEQVSFFKVRPCESLKIPKIFHYVWFGKKLPAEYLPFLQTWKDYHPDWTFIYWVDNPENYDLGTVLPEHTFEHLAYDLRLNALPSNHIVMDVKNLNFDNKAFFDEATNYGEKSDIIKWEVVYRFGGTYIDIDFECLKPFDMLHHMYDFYTGIQPLDTNLVQLGAALFGAIPGHPILKHCVETIKHDRHKQQIILKTGPIHFTKSFLAQAGGHKDLIDIALPASYFYPCGYEQKGWERDKWLRPESFAVHHWAGSWLKPEATKRNIE